MPVFDSIHPDGRALVRGRFAALVREKGGLERMRVRGCARPTATTAGSI